MISGRNLLISQSISRKELRLIKSAVLSVEGVSKINSLKAVNAGLDNLIVLLKIHVVHDLETKQIERLIDRIQKNVDDALDFNCLVNIEIESD